MPKSQQSWILSLHLPTHSGIKGAADEAVLNNTQKEKFLKKSPFNYTFPNFTIRGHYNCLNDFCCREILLKPPPSQKADIGKISTYALADGK